MKLYYLPGACPLASHIALEWAGKPYETQRVTREEIKEPPFLAMNPVGAVPVLTDGDFTLTQSAAILEYIAEKNPEAGLMPDDLKGRAEVRRWLGFCNADLHRTFGDIFGVARLLEEEPAQKELIASCSNKLVNLFTVADKQLEGKQWIAGKRSITDPYLYTLLRWAKAKEIKIDHLKNLAAFVQRMEADPGVQAALKEQGLS